jgi:hypothetical protein
MRMVAVYLELTIRRESASIPCIWQRSKGKQKSRKVENRNGLGYDPNGVCWLGEDVKGLTGSKISCVIG